MKGTTVDKIMILMRCRCTFINYNKLPLIHMYWSTKNLSNVAISRDQFEIPFSKLHFFDLIG